MNIEKYNINHNLEEILSIDLEAVEDFKDKIKDAYNQSDIQNIRKYYFDKNGSFFIGLISNQIICMCGYIPIDKMSVELKRLRVLKNLRGNGYGSKMLSFIEKEIKTNGFSTIKFATASVRKDTLKFYKKHGYIITGNDKFGQLKTILFEKNLN